MPQKNTDSANQTPISNQMESISVGDRIIITIGKYPFYLSSGYNSQAAHTWLAFNGVEIDGWTGNLHFIKAWDNPFANKESVNEFAAREIFPDDIVNRFVDFHEGYPLNYLMASFLTRVGNMETLVISMELGGGFWDSVQGKQLAELLNTKYRPYVESVRTEFASDLAAVKALDLKAAKVIDTKDIDSAADEAIAYLKSRLPDFEVPRHTMFEQMRVNDKALEHLAIAESMINRSLDASAIRNAASTAAESSGFFAHADESQKEDGEIYVQKP